MEYNITKKMISSYLETKKQNDIDEEFINIQLEEKFFDEIKKEILRGEEANIKQQIKSEVEKTLEIERFRGIKRLMYEGFGIAILVGLIANQLTNLLSFMKGTTTSIKITKDELLTISDNVNVTITLLIIIILCIVAFLIYSYKFVAKVIKFNERESS